MIIGIGNDLVDIRRIEKMLARYEDRFTARVFTPAEREKSDARYYRAASYARRFASKEACAKALGTGIAGGVCWQDMGVSNLSGGQPVMLLTGGAAKRLEALTPEGCRAHIHLAITDDFPFAQAVVTISALPA